MLRDKDGNRLFRRLDVKVIFPEGVLPFRDKTFIHHAPPHKGYGPENVDQILETIANDLDSLYPWWNFTPVELQPVGRTARWIIKFAGYNPNYKDTTQQASNTPEGAAAADVKPVDFALAGNTIQPPPAEASHE